MKKLKKRRETLVKFSTYILLLVVLVFALIILEKSITIVTYEINPYDADVKSCVSSIGKEYPTTGNGSASWFVWGGCAHNKYYNVEYGKELIFRVRTDSCPSCVCYNPNFYVYEYTKDGWIETKYFDLPDEKGIIQDVSYTPTSTKIKIYAPDCFYLDIYGTTIKFSFFNK